MKGSKQIKIVALTAAIYYIFRFTVWLWHNEPKANDHALFILLITLLSTLYLGWTIWIFMELSFDDEHVSNWLNPFYLIYRLIKWVLNLSDKYLGD